MHNEGTPRKPEYVLEDEREVQVAFQLTWSPYDHYAPGLVELLANHESDQPTPHSLPLRLNVQQSDELRTGLIYLLEAESRSGGESRWQRDSRSSVPTRDLRRAEDMLVDAAGFAPDDLYRIRKLGRIAARFARGLVGRTS